MQAIQNFLKTFLLWELLHGVVGYCCRQGS